MKVKHPWKTQLIALAVVAAIALCLVPILKSAQTSPHASAAGSLADASIDSGDRIVAYGVDVSFWQKEVDFEALRDAGADFVILRAGYRTSVDSYFEENYAKAKAAGLDVGAYWYSYALTPEEAYEEACACMEHLRGKVFEYPIYLDYEDETQLALEPALSGEICTVFLDTLSNNGYYAGIYSSISHLQDKIPLEPVQTKYQRWMAWYPNSGTYASFGDYCEDYGMWQYSPAGTVAGVDGNVDMNVCFIDYPTIIRSNGLNGYAALQSESTLTLTGVSCPDTLPSDALFSCGGTVASTAGEITNLVAGFYSESGVLETGYSLHPDAETFDLSSLEFSEMFSRLSSGTHFFRVTASNGAETLTLLNTPVQITPQAFSAAELTYPTRMYAGNTFRFCGRISSSDGDITRIAAQIFDDSGMLAAEAEMTPDSASAELSQEFSDSLCVSELPEGRYRYCLLAENSSDMAVILERNFVVTGRQNPMEAGSYYLTETAVGAVSVSAPASASFRLVCGDDGYYFLQDSESEQVLSPENHGNCAGSRLIWAENEGLACQQWKLIPAQDGGFYLLSRSAEVYLSRSDDGSGFVLSLTPVSYSFSEPVSDTGEESAPQEPTSMQQPEPSLPTIAAEPSADFDWVLVTDISQLQIGDSVIIAAANGSAAMAGQDDSSLRSAAAAVRDGDLLSVSDEVRVVTVCAGYDGNGIALYDAEAGGYLGNATSQSCLRTYSILTAGATWTLSINDGIASLQCAGASASYLMYDPARSAFVCCDGTLSPIAIFTLKQ